MGNGQRAQRGAIGKAGWHEKPRGIRATTLVRGTPVGKPADGDDIKFTRVSLQKKRLFIAEMRA